MLALAFACGVIAAAAFEATGGEGEIEVALLEARALGDAALVFVVRFEKGGEGGVFRLMGSVESAARNGNAIGGLGNARAYEESGFVEGGGGGAEIARGDEERAVRASLNLGVSAGGEAILSALCECRERGVETAHVDCGLRERGAFAGSKRFVLEGATRDCSVGAV